MSNYEWERGSIKLPAAEYERVRGAVIAHVNADSEAYFAKTQEFWASLTPAQKRDREQFRDAFATFEKANTSKKVGPDRRSMVSSDLPEGFADMVGVPESYRQDQPWKASRVNRSEFSFPSAREEQFLTRNEQAAMTFDKEHSTVSWHVQESAHAREKCRESPEWAGLAEALRKVKWTINTGGAFLGNDEESREETWTVRGGRNYYTNGFGPIGAVKAPECTADFRMADGTVIRPFNHGSSRMRTGVHIDRQLKGAPNSRGGQFMSPNNSAPESTLLDTSL